MDADERGEEEDDEALDGGDGGSGQRFADHDRGAGDRGDEDLLQEAEFAIEDDADRALQ